MKITIKWVFVLFAIVAVCITTVINIVRIQHEKQVAEEIKQGAKMDHDGELYLIGEQFDGESLRALVMYAPITSLVLVDTNVTDRDFLDVASDDNLSSCAYLEIRSDQMTCEVLNGIKNLAKLQELRLSLSESLIDRRISLLESNCALAALDLAGSHITNEGFASLGRLKHLRVLDLSYTNLDDGKVRHVSNLVSIERLVLRGCDVTAEGLGALSKMHRLQEISVSECEFLKHSGFVRHFDDIRSVDLSGTPIGDSGIEALKQCGSLQRVDLTGTYVSSSAIDAFREHRPKVVLVSPTGHELRGQANPEQ